MGVVSLSRDLVGCRHPDGARGLDLVVTTPHVLVDMKHSRVADVHFFITYQTAPADGSEADRQPQGPLLGLYGAFWVTALVGDTEPCPSGWYSVAACHPPL